jgi:multiple sugar transport system substrate-binding protein
MAKHMGVTRRALVGQGAVMAAAAAPLLAACGVAGQGAAGQQGQQAAPALRAGTTIQFWNNIAGAYTQLMQRWAERFQQRTGVKVEVTDNSQDYEPKMTAAYAGGTPPDIYRYRPEAVPLPLAVQQNRLLKLDDYVKRDRYDLADFRKDAVGLYRWKGVQYGLPRDYGLQLLFYNTDIFAREGVQPIPASHEDKTWTFQKLLEAAQKLTRGEERFAFYLPRTGRRFYCFPYSNGGALVKKNADGLATELAVTERPFVDGLQFAQDLVFRHRVAPTPEQERALGSEANAFQQGKIAMWLNNPGANAQLLTAGVPYDVGVFPIGPSGARRGLGGGGTGWAIAQPTKAPEETWAFLAYISSKEGQLDEVAIGGTTPSRVSVATGKEFLDPSRPPQNSKVFAEGQEYVVNDPVHARWPELESQVLSKLLNEQVWTNKARAAQVLREVKELGDPLLKS